MNSFNSQIFNYILNDFKILATTQDRNKIIIQDSNIQITGDNEKCSNYEIQKVALKIYEDFEELNASLRGNIRTGWLLKLNSSTVNVVQQALEKYKLLGFEEFFPLSEQINQLPSLLTSVDIESESMRQFYSEVEPNVVEELTETLVSLSKANDIINDPIVRVHYMPQVAGASTANGAYYLQKEASTRELAPSTSKPNLKRSFVAKPALQEAGTPGNPRKNCQIRDGIAGGEGAIRERLVYKGQQLLEIDCGIPCTILAKGQSSLLSSGPTMAKILESLELIQKINPNLTFDKFLSLMKDGYDIRGIVEFINSQQEGPDPFDSQVDDAIESLKKEGIEVGPITVCEHLKKHHSTSEINRHLAAIKKFFPEEEETPSLTLSNSLHNLVEEVTIPDAKINLEQEVKTIWSELLTRAEENVLMSMQKYIEGCHTLGGLSESLQNNLPVVEVHKFVIDLIFFNTDRHLQNALVKFEGDNPTIILIDHGSCLPDPCESQECIGLKQASFEFLALPQCNMPLHEKFAKPIDQLNIEEYIEGLKKDQLLHKDKFETLCHIPDSCYNLIRLNLCILKIGIKLNLSFKKIASFHQIQLEANTVIGGEIAYIYANHIKGKDQIDWNGIEEEIKNMIVYKGD